jgi:hypothetical protein
MPITIFTWHDLQENHRVLELHECVTPPDLALELHIVPDPESLGSSLAWWQTDRGAWLAAALVGEV